MKQILQNLKTGETEVVVPKHLCVKVPETVGDDAAAFMVLAAIALQGVRLVQPALGEAGRVQLGRDSVASRATVGAWCSGVAAAEAS